jgi:hypothetical protein
MEIRSGPTHGGPWLFTLRSHRRHIDRRIEDGPQGMEFVLNLVQVSGCVFSRMAWHSRMADSASVHCFCSSLGSAGALRLHHANAGTDHPTK